LVYPVKEKVTIESGKDTLGSYSFGNKVLSHFFCKSCGSSVFFEVLRPPSAALAEAEAKGQTLPTIVGMNVCHLKLAGE
jgi:hypothetical protein